MNIWITGTVVLFIGLGLFFFIAMLVDSWKLRKLRRKYKIDDDRSKQGEQRRSFGKRELVVEGYNKPSTERIFPTTTSSSIGENNLGLRKTSKGTRGFFAIFRKGRN